MECGFGGRLRAGPLWPLDTGVVCDKQVQMDTRFRLTFPDTRALQSSWDKDLSQGRFFVPTNEMLPPFSKAVLVFLLDGFKHELEIEAEVVFVLEPGRGPQPGLGLSFQWEPTRLKVAKAFVEQRWDDFERMVSRPALRQAGAAPKVKSKVPPGPKLDPELNARVLGDVRAYMRAVNGRNHYRVLAVESDAPEKDIRRAYSKLMRRFHPDNYFRRLSRETMTELEVAYQIITEAYETLMTDESRAAYDIKINNFGGAKNSSKRKVAMWRKQSYTKVNPKLVKLSESLLKEARLLVERGDHHGAQAKLKLALRYNPHMDEARALMEALGQAEG